MTKARGKAATNKRALVACIAALVVIVSVAVLFPDGFLARWLRLLWLGD